MKTDLSRRLYLISDVVSLTGASRSFINDLRKRNFVQVAAGKKHNMKFDTIGLLTIGLVHSLRRKGATLSMIKPLAAFISSLSVDDLLAAFDDGKTILVSAGDLMPPRLAGEVEHISNRSSWNEILVCIDLQECWQRIEKGVADYDQRKPILN